MRHLRTLVILAVFVLPRFAFGQTTFTVGPTPTPKATLSAVPSPTPSAHEWSVKEILAEKPPGRPRPPVNYCQGGIFEPCICASDVPRAVRYRPAVTECNGDAAVILGGKFKNVFSVVVRDTDNRDRSPDIINSCNAFEAQTQGLAKCSAFKVQEKIRIGRGKKEAIMHCLGASGYSTTFRRVVRMTIKLADDPRSTNDPLVRYCLAAGRIPLN